MRPLDPTIEKQHTIVRILALAMFVGAPLMYLLVGYFVTANQPPADGGQFDILFYILLFVAVVQPFIIPIIESAQLSRVKLQEKTARQVAALYQVTFILKAAFIEAIFLYGLVVYILTPGAAERMLAFYVIGIGWILVHWPTRGRLNDFLEKAGRYV